MKRFITHIAILIIVLGPAAASADRQAGIETFKSGVGLSSEGRYGEAIESLWLSYEELPAIGDYVLLYIAKAHVNNGEFDNASDVTEALVMKYPNSRLIPQARKMQAEIVARGDWDKAIKHLARYMEDYPSDLETKFAYAEILRKRGMADEAMKIYKELYINAGAYSAEAGLQLEGSELGGGELYVRAAKLLETGKSEEASKIFEKLINAPNGLDPKKIASGLGQSYFNLKRYIQAAGMFEVAGDYFNAARSYLRAGMIDKMEDAVAKAEAAKDDKIAELFFYLSEERRREGRMEEALRMLERASAMQEPFREEAYWRIGWAYYASKDFENARKVFYKLSGDYKSGKYVYWLGRSTEKIGLDADYIYRDVNNADYYTLMAKRKIGAKTNGNGAANNNNNAQLKPMQRVDLLLEAGLIDEAAREVLFSASKTNTPSELIPLAYRLRDMGKYSEAIGLTNRVPEKLQPLDIMFPLAFWPLVSGTAENYEIDPYLLLSLIREESRFDPSAASAAGALGLMQLMPATAERTGAGLKISINGRESICNVENNVKIGTHYFKNLLSEFQSVPAALAAYNAGESRVRKWIKEGNYESHDEFVEDIPYKETRNYVKRILSSYYRYMNSGYAGENAAAGTMGM